MNWNKTILRILACLQAIERRQSERDTRGLGIVRVLASLLCILLCALSTNAVFTVTLLTFEAAYVALMDTDSMMLVLRALPGPVLFTVLIVLPAAFMGSPGTILTLTMKVTQAVTVLSILRAQTRWQELTGALGSLFVPPVFIFVLDLTVRCLVFLGRCSNTILEAVKLRSFGNADWRHSGIGGILGVAFLKAQRMERGTEEAMRLRGFEGELRTIKRKKAGIWDAVYVLGMILMTAFFAYTQIHR